MGAGLRLAGCWRHRSRALGVGGGFPSLEGGLVVWSVWRRVTICSSSLHNLRREESWNHTSPATARWVARYESVTPCGEHAATASWRSLELNSVSFRMRSS